MTDLRKAAEMALEALEKDPAPLNAINNAKCFLYSALEQPSDSVEQEPVAHLWECLGRWSAYLATNGTQADCAPPDYLVKAVEAVTAPPSKPWVSLTMRDYHEFLNLGTFESFKAIEAALKEKNT